MAWPLTRGGGRAAQPAPDRTGESAGSLLRFVIVLAIVAWAVRSFVAAPFYIPSGSMLPALYVGDYIVVAKWPYGYSRFSFPWGVPGFNGRLFMHLPDRGDVVVFRHPGEDADLVKRVIGLPGDRIAVRDGRLMLNGQMVPRAPLAAVRVPVSPNSACKAVPPAAPRVASASGRPVCLYPAFRETLPGAVSYIVLDQVSGGPADDFAETVVPAGRLFLMGDNRDDSLDSRFAPFEGGIGMVPVDQLIGRAAVTFWSTDGSASYWKPWSWFSALRAGRIGNGYSGDSE